MISHTVAFLLGAVTAYAGLRLYRATRPQGSPWRGEVRRWWGRNEDIIEVERRRRAEEEERLWAATHPPSPTDSDTPPHREGDRPPVTLRQPGAGSEGRDAATSDHHRRLVAFDNDDPAGAWLQGQIAEYLGPVSGTGGQVHGFRLSGSDEVLDLTDPFGRGLVHRVLGDEPGISA